MKYSCHKFLATTPFPNAPIYLSKYFLFHLVHPSPSSSIMNAPRKQFIRPCRLLLIRSEENNRHIKHTASDGAGKVIRWEAKDVSVSRTIAEALIILFIRWSIKQSLSRNVAEEQETFMCWKREHGRAWGREIYKRHEIWRMLHPSFSCGIVCRLPQKLNMKLINSYLGRHLESERSFVSRRSTLWEITHLILTKATLAHPPRTYFGIKEMLLLKHQKSLRLNAEAEGTSLFIAFCRLYSEP